MFVNVPVDADMAEVILAAMSVCENEGITGLSRDHSMTCEQYSEVEERVIRVLYSAYPNLVKTYDYLDCVKRALGTK